MAGISAEFIRSLYRAVGVIPSFGRESIAERKMKLQGALKRNPNAVLHEVEDAMGVFNYNDGSYDGRRRPIHTKP